ncbi:hypothetical protein DKM44_08050 [Deinococcus irradiatisoli]|uniref:GlcNAc-PI de-N-acetylase n=1 Tax=Deinococcus irradiatisoli TaxID=2202254 RepID=A0A2Z3JDR5_9DEIO|nr:PIG-L family deacetylase [Deinococcus irradiatisoli]AWN23182.1 hypothetical protein DKM44_08050 [Deinococcus irradiatisoli]
MKKAIQICGMVVLSVSLFACSRDTSSTAPTTKAGDQAAVNQVQPNIQSQATSKYGRIDPEVPRFNSLKGQGIVPTQKVYFNVSAHADDWELFFSPEVYREVTNDSTKNVFIYTTAGDGGAGRGPVRSNPYYKAREDGANTAVRFIANVTATDDAQPVVSNVSIAGHTMRKITYRNTVSYFLRLPDGAPDGLGFNGQSLQLLATKKIPKITALDKSTSYVSWADLTNTVNAIVKKETGNLGTASFNLMDSDPVVKVDHSDHIYTTMLMNTVREKLPCVDAQYFLTYWKNYTPEYPINMQSEDLINHAAVVGVMQAAEADVGYPGSWDEFHKSFIGKDYSRTVPATSTSPCI